MTVDIGPECFASEDGEVICWKGRNYYISKSHDDHTATDQIGWVPPPAPQDGDGWAHLLLATGHESCGYIRFVEVVNETFIMVDVPPVGGRKPQRSFLNGRYVEAFRPFTKEEAMDFIESAIKSHEEQQSAVSRAVDAAIGKPSGGSYL